MQGPHLRVFVSLPSVQRTLCPASVLDIEWSIPHSVQLTPKMIISSQLRKIFLHCVLFLCGLQQELQEFADALHTLYLQNSNSLLGCFFVQVGLKSYLSPSLLVDHNCNIT